MIFLNINNLNVSIEGKKILNDFNFEVIGVKDSQIPSSTAKKYAKRLIFKNKNYD